MSAAIATAHLTLVPRTRADVRADIERMPPEMRREISAAYLALLDASAETDPWIHGFSVRHRESGEVVGSCGFKGPPVDGVVEIAYAIDPDHQGRGYATEAAAALTAFALGAGPVEVVLAHTLPHESASTRVLTKCGFEKTGEVVDPDDGPVWRWRRGRNQLSLEEASRALAEREPIFHRPEYGTSREDFERMTDAAFWEVGASGRVYSREFVLETLAGRDLVRAEESWKVTDFACRAVSANVFLVTYRLEQEGGRLSRRSTLWRFSEIGWQALYHQGTLIPPA